MSQLKSAVEIIRRAAVKPALPLDARSEMLDAAITAMDDASQDELDDAVAQLIPALDSADPYCGGIASMAIGALLESGANTKPASGPLRRALASRMREASRFAETWRAGEPPACDVEHIEAFHATVNRKFVEPDELQNWAARDAGHARTWSRMDDWFLPIMALARMDAEGRREIVEDEDLRQAYGALKAADPSMFLWGELGNSKAGTHFEGLMADNAMPAFADELPKRAEPEGPAKLLDDMARRLRVYCDEPDVVIQVEMDFAGRSPSVSVVRHVRDPANLFDRSKDKEISLCEADLDAIESLVGEYNDLMPSEHTTLSVYADGAWSVGSRSRG